MNLGLVGAIGGAAKGFDSYITEEQAMQRQQRLENLKTRNARETNNLNNKQRHSQSVELQGIKNKDDISLTEMRNKARMDEVNAISGRPTTGQANMQTLIEQGLTPEQAIDRIFPKGGRTGSSQLDVQRDAFKSMVRDMIDSGSTPEDAGTRVGQLMEQAGLTQSGSAPVQFQSLQEALDRARADYPDADPDMLQQRILEKFPDLAPQ